MGISCDTYDQRQNKATPTVSTTHLSYYTEKDEKFVKNVVKKINVLLDVQTKYIKINDNESQKTKHTNY